jgi:hypothetical protein
LTAVHDFPERQDRDSAGQSLVSGTGASRWVSSARGDRSEGRSAFLLAGVLLLAGLVQAWVVAAGRIHWNSDEAVVAIMATDILEHGVHPAFYYGSAYAGTLEPHWVAAVFGAFGKSVLAYRLAMGALLTGLLCVVHRLARTRFSAGTALLATAYLALPPWFFLYKGLTSDGHYDAAAILGAASLYAALRLEEALRHGRPALAWIAALGLALGAAWWTDPLSSYFDLAIGLWFLVVQPFLFVRPIAYPTFLAGFVAGGFPWWVSNLRWQWKSLHAPELAAVGPAQMADQFRSVFTLGLPIVVGARPVFNRTETYSGELLISLALAFLPLTIGLAFVWRRRKELRAGESRDEAGAGRGILLLLLTLVSGILLVSTNNRSDLAEPRFLFPLYPAFAILFAFSVSRLWRSRGLGRLAGAALLALALYSAGRGLCLPGLYRIHLNPTNNGSLADLIREMEQRRLRSAYASYWVAYRLAFESGEHILATPFGNSRLVRVPRYRVAADADPRPAFILFGDEADEMAFYLNARGEQFTDFFVGPFRVFYGLSPETLRRLKVLDDIPVRRKPSRVRAGSAEGRSVSPPSLKHLQAFDDPSRRVVPRPLRRGLPCGGGSASPRLDLVFVHVS